MRRPRIWPPTSWSGTGPARAPGCGRPAAGCDLDHTVPYPHGHTCADNLGGGCRHHHLFKTAGVWSVVQRPDGMFVFRTATGLERTVHPADLREALHLMRATEPQRERDHERGTDRETDATEQDPDAA